MTRSVPTYTPPVTVATFRRAAIAAGIVTAVAVVVLVLVGYPSFGLFFVVGVALGTLNMWLAVRSVARFATHRPSKVRFSGSVLGRLAVITVASLVVAWLVRPAGIAVFAGLALFQFLAIVSSMLPLIKEIRQK
jgi:ATP synthase I subunit